MLDAIGINSVEIMPGTSSPLDIDGWNSLAEKEREEDNGREDTCGNATLKGENNVWSTDFFEILKSCFFVRMKYETAFLH